MAVAEQEPTTAADGAVPDPVADPIERFGLHRNVADLDRVGYTVVPDVVPLDQVAALREAILRCAAEDRDAGLQTMNFGEHTQLVWRVLLRGREFEDAICVPQIDALMTHLLGGGYRLSVVNSSVLSEGAQPQFLHSDNTLVPEPFPSWPMTATAVIPCDEFTGDNGSTIVVPGSHRLLRHPQRGEGRDRSVAIEAPLGSIVVWNGALWHRSGRRNNPGERVVFHASFMRAHMAAYENYVGLVTPEQLDRNPPRFAQLLGVDLPWGFESMSGPDASKVFGTAQRVGLF